MASIPVGLSVNETLGCLYVVQIARTRIKVGLTINPWTRLADHRGIAEAHGCIPGPEWVSPRGGGTIANENALIEFCTARATVRFRNEYFTGVPFLAAVREAARICGDREALSMLARPRAAQTLTALAGRRKRPGGPLPFLVEAADKRAAEMRRLNPWIGRPGTCTEAEAAEWLGVSEGQVVIWVSTGEILRVPARDPHRRLYLRTADVERVALHGLRTRRTTKIPVE